MSQSDPDTSPLDIESALEKLAGDVGILEVVMQSFAESFADTRAALDQALAANHFDEAERLVHAIKGLAPNVGANSLYPLAKQFEAQLALRDSRLHQAFAQELQHVLQAIDDWLCARASAPTA